MDAVNHLRGQGKDPSFQLIEGSKPNSPPERSTLSITEEFLIKQSCENPPFRARELVLIIINNNITSLNNNTEYN